MQYQGAGAASQPGARRRRPAPQLHRLRQARRARRGHLCARHPAAAPPGVHVLWGLCARRGAGRGHAQLPGDPAPLVARQRVCARPRTEAARPARRQAPRRGLRRRRVTPPHRGWPGDASGAPDAGRTPPAGVRQPRPPPAHATRPPHPSQRRRGTRPSDRRGRVDGGGSGVVLVLGGGGGGEGEGGGRCGGRGVLRNPRGERGEARALRRSPSHAAFHPHTLSCRFWCRSRRWD